MQNKDTFCKEIIISFHSSRPQRPFQLISSLSYPVTSWSHSLTFLSSLVPFRLLSPKWSQAFLFYALHRYSHSFNLHFEPRTKFALPTPIYNSDRPLQPTFSMIFPVLAPGSFRGRHEERIWKRFCIWQTFWIDKSKQTTPHTVVGIIFNCLKLRMRDVTATQRSISCSNYDANIL